MDPVNFVISSFSTEHPNERTVPLRYVQASHLHNAKEPFCVSSIYSRTNSSQRQPLSTHKEQENS